MKVRAKNSPLVAEWDVAVDAPPRLRLVLPATERGVHPWLLVWWLLIASLVWSALAFVVPDFKRMFTETGVSFPVMTELLVAASTLMREPLGVVFGLAVLLSSIETFRRFRRRSWVRWALTVLVVGGIAFLPFALFALFTPVIHLGSQKL